MLSGVTPLAAAGSALPEKLSVGRQSSLQG
jgi:hypothetical protein